MGHMGCFSEARVKVYHRNIWLEQPTKLAVAEHIFNQDHNIQLQKTKILSISSDYMLIRWQLRWHSIPTWKGRMVQLYMTQDLTFTSLKNTEHPT